MKQPPPSDIRMIRSRTRSAARINSAAFRSECNNAGLRGRSISSLISIPNRYPGIFGRLGSELIEMVPVPVDARVFCVNGSYLGTVGKQSQDLPNRKPRVGLRPKMVVDLFDEEIIFAVVDRPPMAHRVVQTCAPLNVPDAKPFGPLPDERSRVLALELAPRLQPGGFQDAHRHHLNVVSVRKGRRLKVANIVVQL